MIARHTRIRDNQILIDFSPHAEGTMVEIDVALLVALDEDQDGEYSGTCVRYWTSNGLESHGATAEVLSDTIMTALEVCGKGHKSFCALGPWAGRFLNFQPSGSSTTKSGNRLLLGIIDLKNCN